MRKLVREGYEKGDYVGVFRKNKELNSFEEPIVKEFLSYLPEGSRILDLGCGSGIPYDLYLTGSGFYLTGVDFSEKHIKMARENVPQGKFILADYTDAGLPPESFDGVVSFYSIFHIPREEHLELFSKINKVLRPGGVLLVTLGTSSYGYSDEEDWAGSPLMAWSSWSPDEYIEMLPQAGFESLSTFFEGKPGDAEHHFWLIARKVSGL